MCEPEGMPQHVLMAGQIDVGSLLQDLALVPFEKSQGPVPKDNSRYRTNIGLCRGRSGNPSSLKTSAELLRVLPDPRLDPSRTIRPQSLRPSSTI
jgi:hypothetical protein